MYNHISRNECIKLFDRILKYSIDEIETIKKNIESIETEIDPEKELLLYSSKQIIVDELDDDDDDDDDDDEEPRNIFKAFNVDDLDRLIDFTDDEDE